MNSGQYISLMSRQGGVNPPCDDERPFPASSGLTQISATSAGALAVSIPPDARWQWIDIFRLKEENYQYHE
jgi:hypothetical protein